MPPECHDRKICVAHERLADIVDAVVRVGTEVRNADIVKVMPQDLSQHAQAVEMVICAQLAKVTAAILQLNRVVCAVQLLHLLGCEAQVVMLEEMSPCLLCLGTRFSSILVVQAKTSIELMSMVSFDGFLCRSCVGLSSAHTSGQFHVKSLTVRNEGVEVRCSPQTRYF